MRMLYLIWSYKGSFTVLVVGSLAACSPAKTSEVAGIEQTENSSEVEHIELTANPYTCQSSTEPRPDNDFGSFSPDCACVTSVTTGPSWRELTIGESTLDDVQAVLETEGTRSSLDNAWHFRDPHTPIIWFNAEACFVDERLSILLITIDPDTRNRDVDQLLEEYGPPNRVTWGPDFASRSLIWSERGLLIFVSAAGGRGGSIVLYPPIPQDALQTSWLMASLPDGPIGSPVSDVTWGGDLTKEDPWGIEQPYPEK